MYNCKCNVFSNVWLLMCSYVYICMYVFEYVYVRMRLYACLFDCVYARLLVCVSVVVKTEVL